VCAGGATAQGFKDLIKKSIKSFLGPILMHSKEKNHFF
jgi:hypothetical protein